MVTVKYILIILHADNDGEGGTFSTYSLLSRYVSIFDVSIVHLIVDTFRQISQIEIHGRNQWSVR